MKQQWFNITRIGGISDGVFAIAMTLLVLELKLPELEDPISREAFNQALLGQVPHFISWIISFAILCRLWITQHALLEYGDKKSRGFTTMNFVFLGAISFIPFPTSLISEHYNHPLSSIIFSVSLFIAGLSFSGMCRSLEKVGLEPEKLNEIIRRVRRVIILLLVIAVISCLLTTVSPELGILVWIVFPFAGLTMKRKRAPKEKS